jgi:hypothetical protein
MGENGPQRLNLRGNSNSLPIVSVIKRLDAKRIARKKNAAAALDGKRIHAAQVFDDAFTVLLVGVQQHFSI